MRTISRELRFGDHCGGSLMETFNLARMANGLFEKRETIENWLRTTPPWKRKVQLGPSPEADVRAKLQVLDEVIERARRIDAPRDPHMPRRRNAEKGMCARGECYGEPLFLPPFPRRPLVEVLAVEG